VASVLLAEELAPGVAILDRTHHSEVLGETRNYRIFLPPNFEESGARRYPVIYYFHGWSQRYFGSQPGKKQYEQGEDNDGDNFAAFVAAHNVIIVKWDGFNPRYPGEQYLRPYNIGPVETHRQFPLYFPELVHHIDQTYPTIPDREHRAVTGLSMGGFMAFWVGGKYPDLVGSVSNFMGSDEFVVGPRGFPVEYRHTEMYDNYGGRRVRLHMGSRDFIRGYHSRMNRTWDFVMDSFEHTTYDSDHGSAGLSEMLAFHMRAFADPWPLPETFDHIDVYPRFDVRGYQVSSDRRQPGFSLLERVSSEGFRLSARRWLPDGPGMSWVNLSVLTAPIYSPQEEFVVTDIDLSNGRLLRERLRSDQEGRLRFSLDGGIHEVGIVPSGAERPILVLAKSEWTDQPWLEAGTETEFILTIANKGTRSVEFTHVEITPHDSAVKVIRGSSTTSPIYPGGLASTRDPLRILASEEADRVRLNLVLSDGAGREWGSSFTLPVQRPGPEVKDFQIADGRPVTVLEYGNQRSRKYLGRGNGDGVANPGEEIVVLVPDGDLLRMTEITSHDPCLRFDRDSDYWGGFDHVGSSNKVTKLLIKTDGTAGRTIPLHFFFLAPDPPVHTVRAGRVSLRVEGSDETPPWLDFLSLSSDGVLFAKLCEGGQIRRVYAEIRNPSELDRRHPVELFDDGLEPDLRANDSIFAGRFLVRGIESRSVRVTVTATDDDGNQAILTSEILPEKSRRPGH
jgi:hypothetical protein